MTQNVLVLGGTRFFGKHLVNELLTQGANVTIATRGKTPDSFGPKVTRLIFDREDEDSIRSVLTKETYDVIYDNIAYTSNDIDILMSLPNAILSQALCLFIQLSMTIWSKKILIQQHMLIVL